MRERYGFTAYESLDMAYEEFDTWLEALAEDEDGSGAGARAMVQRTGDGQTFVQDDSWEAV